MSSMNNLINKDDSEFPHEEYGLLLQLTAPGTIRRLRNKLSTRSSVSNTAHGSSGSITHTGNNNNDYGSNNQNYKSKRKTNCIKNRLDIVMADDLYDTRPNGIVLPKVLRKKLLVQDMMSSNSSMKDSSSTNTRASTNIRNSSDDDAKELNRASLLDHLDTIEQMTLRERILMHQQKQQQQQQQQNQMNPTLLPHTAPASSLSSSSSSSSHFNPNTTLSSKKSTIIENTILQQIEKESEIIHPFLPKRYTIPQQYDYDNNNNKQYIFTTNELEQKISLCYSALFDIQKQLSRGEELYFQETDTHGNLYKQWDSIIDVKAEQVGIPNYDIGIGGGVGADPLEYVKINGNNNNNIPNRRMNNDMRWFSLSSNVTEQSFMGSARIGGGGNNGTSNRNFTLRRQFSSSLSPIPSTGGTSGRLSSRSMVSDGDSNNNNKNSINNNNGTTRTRASSTNITTVDNDTSSSRPDIVHSSSTTTSTTSNQNKNPIDEPSINDNDVDVMKTREVKVEDNDEIKVDTKQEQNNDDKEMVMISNLPIDDNQVGANDNVDDKEKEGDKKILLKQQNDDDEKNNEKELAGEIEEKEHTIDIPFSSISTADNEEYQDPKKRKLDQDADLQDEDDATSKQQGRPRKTRKK